MDETMLPARLRILRRFIVLGAMAIGAPGGLDAQDRVGQSSPMEVTTDTPEYCLHLLDRVSELVRIATAPVPREVTDLTTEGHRMCAHGQIRGGIMRLRSAVMIMETGDSAAH